MPRGVVNSDPAMSYITRLQDCSGWQVSIRRRGKRYAASFYDCRHGGRQRALVAARAWRDRQLKELVPLERREFAMIVRTNNTSGYPGVTRIEKRTGFVYWHARTDLPNGKSLNRTFAVTKYGEEGARARAIEERKQQLKHVTGVMVYSPVAKSA
jgi:hypothetical protein